MHSTTTFILSPILYLSSKVQCSHFVYGPETDVCVAVGEQCHEKVQLLLVTLFPLDNGMNGSIAISIAGISIHPWRLKLVN